MARWIWALAALSIAGVAQAQTNTTCQNNGYGVVNCTTTAPPQFAPLPPPAPAGGVTAFSLLMAARQAAVDRKAQQSNAAVLKNVSDMVLVGDCDGAVTVAIRAGRMDLAAQARAACKPVAEPYKPR